MLDSDKFSVIIPTMWYSDKIQENIERLDDSEYVNEIILIDNNTSLKPNYIEKYTKIKYLPQKENIYVNPAWNLGVEESLCENICISNDDVIFDADIFSFIKEHLDVGIYGMSTDNYYIEGKDSKYLVSKINQRPWGWGCLFFVKKKNWVPIHSDLKIACGDDWLIKHTEGGAYQIDGLGLSDDRVSITSIRSEFSDTQTKDIEIWSQYLR